MALNRNHPAKFFEKLGIFVKQNWFYAAYVFFGFIALLGLLGFLGLIPGFLPLAFLGLFTVVGTIGLLGVAVWQIALKIDIKLMKEETAVLKNEKLVDPDYSRWMLKDPKYREKYYTKIIGNINNALTNTQFLKSYEKVMKRFLNRPKEVQINIFLDALREAKREKEGVNYLSWGVLINHRILDIVKFDPNKKKSLHEIVESIIAYIEKNNREGHVLGGTAYRNKQQRFCEKSKKEKQGMIIASICKYILDRHLNFGAGLEWGLESVKALLILVEAEGIEDLFKILIEEGLLDNKYATYIPEQQQEARTMYEEVTKQLREEKLTNEGIKKTETKGDIKKQTGEQKNQKWSNTPTNSTSPLKPERKF